MRKKIAILGSTGSIGKTLLNIINKHNKEFEIVLLSANKDKKTLADEWYTKLQFVHPGKEGPTALDGISDTAWKESRAMSGELLSKVKRQNKIVVEFKGTSSVSRSD